MFRRFIASLLFLSFLVSTGLSAQIQIDTTMTPQQLVENVLLGGGVSVSNITFNGMPATTLNGQAAKYIGPSNFIEFNEGVVLKSGHTFEVQDPGFWAPFPFPTPNITQDSDLQTLSGQNINNAAILEFDFVPNGDSLMFRYVFASKEYPSFTCSNYNDVFGFFISGPGINGPFSNNAINIALIPGTNVPVGINTLNSGTASGSYSGTTCAQANPDWVEHSMYFVDNGIEPTGDIQFPGLTTTLTAFAVVECGQTYHIKLAIADAMDSGFDSGVFLEAGSFTSSSAVQVLLDTPIGLNDSTLYEGCGTANLQFIRPSQSSNIQETAYLDISGTALNGIHFQPALPDSVVFPIGVDTVTFELFAPVDPNFGGEQYVDVVITNVASDCAGSVVTSDFRFYINRADPLEVSGFDGALADCHDEIKLFPTVVGGYGEYVYNWSNGMTADTITVSPGQSTTYFVTVSDTCGVPGILTSFDVEVPVYPPVQVDIGDDFEVIQCDVTVDIAPEVSGGFGAYTYYWTANGEFISDAQNLNYLIGETSDIKLIATDDCGATATDQITITIPEMEVTAFLPDAFAANSCLTEILLPAISDGGIGQRTHYWSVDGVGQDTSLSAFFMYHPSMGQHVQIKAVDECGNFGIDSTFIPFNFPEVAIKTSRDTVICPKTAAELHVEVLSGSGGYKIDWGSSDSSVYTVKPKGDRYYNVVVTDTCGMTAQGTINVEVRNVRADFDYEYIPYYGLDFTNYSRAVEPEFLWDFGDGQTSTLRNPRHSYTDLIPYRVTLTVVDNIGCDDVVGLNTIPPLEIFIPTSFTPNGDGINDLFEVKGANITEFTMRIFDRWGNLVFYTSDIQDKWDGSNSNDGYHSGSALYNYIIRYKGEKEEDTKEVTGKITVIR